VVSEASRRFGLDLNIVSGRIDAIGNEPYGLMALAAYGSPAAIAEAIGWMRSLGLDVSEIGEDPA
jgi:D-methionine transport system ATP-binding protein